MLRSRRRLLFPGRPDPPAPARCRTRGAGPERASRRPSPPPSTLQVDTAPSVSAAVRLAFEATAAHGQRDEPCSPWRPTRTARVLLPAALTSPTSKARLPPAPGGERPHDGAGGSAAGARAPDAASKPRTVRQALEPRPAMQGPMPPGLCGRAPVSGHSLHRPEVTQPPGRAALLPRSLLKAQSSLPG